MHWIAGALLLSSVLAQEPDVALLQSSDWRERNRTTLALSRQTKPDVAALVRLLAAPPQGETAAAGLWGGRALVFQHPDPHQQVLAAAEFESVRQDATHAAYGLALKAASDLVIPFDSQDLACWLLLQHAPKHPEVAELFTAFVPTTLAQARAWLHCGRPDEERILALLGESASADAVAYALHDAGASYRAVLHKALLTGSPAARRAVFKLTDLELLDAEGVMPVAVAQFLTDSSESARQHAGHLLLQRPEAAARELASQFGDRRTLQRRALAMACLLGEAAAPLTAAALSLVAHRDAVVRQRALTTLARASLPEANRAEAAQVCMSLAAAHADAATRLLAIDALARLGSAVTAEQRQQLAAISAEAPLAVRARIVACLWRLGEPSAQDPATLVEYLADRQSPSDCWLACADAGEDAAPHLQQLLLGLRSQPPAWRWVAASARAAVRHLAAKAPAAVRSWLATELAPLAIEALASLGGDSGLDSREILQLLPEHPDQAEALAKWLQLQPDFAEHAVAILASHAAFPDAPYAWTKLCAGLPLPREHVLESCQEVFAAGERWELIRSWEPALLRAKCRQWLVVATHPAVRNSLLGELARLGLDEREEVELVRAALRQDVVGSALLEGLRHAPRVPASLRPEIEAVFDRWFLATETRFAYAPEVMLLWRLGPP